MSSGSKASSASCSEWLGCHRPVIAAMATLWALARAPDWATVRLECQRGAWDSRWTLPSVLQNWVREDIPRKKLLTFGHCPKVALTPLPPTCFGHTWGNFCLHRFRKNVQLKTTSKQPKKKHKTTSKLPQNYPKTFGIGLTPPPFLSNVQKKAKKKLPKNFWIWVGPPSPLLDDI